MKTNLDQVSIITTNDTRFGIFFRNPFQKILYRTDSYNNDNDITLYDWVKTAKLKIIPYLLNFKKFNKIVHDLKTSDDEFGYIINTLVNPIYFKKKCRELHCHVLDSISPVKEINSFGWEWQWETCSGNCYKEITTITFKNNKKIKLVQYGAYHWTYKHIIEEYLNN